jgi:hypothetical protein
MPNERDLKAEIGHVLFIDLVGYSKLLINEQSEVLHELNAVVRGTERVQAADAAGKLIRLPAGDGMALVFRDSPEAPAECALQIAEALKSHPTVQVRMGIHSGPVNEVVDVNERSNIAGAGINLAQRVMEQPENFSLIEDLALTNMGLGDKAAAFALSERAMAANPIEKDAVFGPAPIEILARVAAQLGEPDRAIAALQKLLSIPYEGPLAANVPLTPALLRLDPMFDPLRSDLRFQKLCKDKRR